MSQDAERLELFDHIARCRDLLAILREPGARNTIEDLIVYFGGQAQGDGHPPSRPPLNEKQAHPQ
jgi:hypothetical protein